MTKITITDPPSEWVDLPPLRGVEKNTMRKIDMRPYAVDGVGIGFKNTLGGYLMRERPISDFQKEDGSPIGNTIEEAMAYIKANFHKPEQTNAGGGSGSINSNYVPVKEITSSSLAGGTDYSNPDYAGKVFRVFYNGGNRFLNAADGFAIKPEGGFVIGFELQAGETLTILT